MPVLVDTCVLALAFRRRSADWSAAEAALCARLADLIDRDEAVLVGPVRQELLSGMVDGAQLERLRRGLRALRDPGLTAADYEHAAAAHNRCRAAGVAGSTVDFLLCGVSLERNWPLLSTDQDFVRYARVLGLRLLPA